MSITIRAVSVGCKVPDCDFRGTVHSVFHSAANIAVPGLDYLLTLLLGERMDLPQGIRIPGEFQGFIEQLTPGQAIACRGGVLRAVDYPYAIDLRGASVYDGRIAVNGYGDGPSVQAAFRTTWNLLVERQAQKEAGLRLTDFAVIAVGETVGEESPDRTAAQRLAGLALAARGMDSIRTLECVRSLVGLGGGLTPTGDDVLVGFLAGLRATAESGPRREWTLQISDDVRVASKRTNDISRSYLILAAEGQFSSALAGLALAISAGEAPEAVREKAEAAFAVGHTSGIDAATGLLAALYAQPGTIFQARPPGMTTLRSEE